MALLFTGTDFDLITQAQKEDGTLINLNDSDILAYGIILFEASGVEIARYSSNGDALGVPWQPSNEIAIEDAENGKLRVHVLKELTQGLITQNITVKWMIQRDATLTLDDHHTDSELWQTGEAERFQINASKDDSVIDMTP